MYVSHHSIIHLLTVLLLCWFGLTGSPYSYRKWISFKAHLPLCWQRSESAQERWEDPFTESPTLPQITFKWLKYFFACLCISANIDSTRRKLYLQVLGGKAFLEHLQEPEPLPGHVCSTYTLYLHFRNQRFHSKPVPCACEPALMQGFLFEIHRDNMGMWFIFVCLQFFHLKIKPQRLCTSGLMNCIGAVWQYF